jgi:hypothetical protein
MLSCTISARYLLKLFVVVGGDIPTCGSVFELDAMAWLSLVSNPVAVLIFKFITCGRTATQTGNRASCEV